MTTTRMLVGAAALGLAMTATAMAEQPAQANGKPAVACGQIVEDYAVSQKKSVDDTAARVHSDRGHVAECLKANGTEVPAADGK